jgi:hypothetical protein
MNNQQQAAMQMALEALEKADSRDGYYSYSEEIIRMARVAGVYLTKIGYEFDTDDLCRFAALVAEAEREKIFKELMDMHRAANGQHNYYQYAVMQLRGEPV